MFKGTNLIEKQFYSTDDFIDRNIRNSLLQAISGLAANAFNDEIRSFSLGDYSIILMTQVLSDPNQINNPSYTPSFVDTLLMFCICEKNTDEKAIQKGMADALFQFQNRYSLNDIYAKKKKKFKKFPERLDNIFKDLILKSEDRFKLLF